MDILIIEDETKTAKELKTMLERLDDDLRVMAILPSVCAGIDWLRTKPPPQLIFSDIQLSDGLSFDIFRAVQAPCPVIFCTAFDQYAIHAFEANGIDYLLKPIDNTKLAASLDKYNRLKRLLAPGERSAIVSPLERLLDQLQPNNHKSGLLIYRNEKIIPLPVRDIAFIHSAGGTVNAHTFTRQIHLLQEVLDELESMLDPKGFFRANRQFLINRDAIVMAEHYFGRRLVLKLSVELPERVIVSKAKASELLAWL
ncbi:LytR/AlgR family response regulator transcription factor [Parapedobacter pyrenivorans]|uniref:LytR/AlgR family response regulator transcription factor n=1 Tax=Parapedobacter pyrenivorans TaxID=1305674 RepID=UPI00333E5187